MARTPLSAKGTNPDRLTDKMRMFVAEYMSNGMNARAAAEAAGYKHPEVTGSRFLRHDKKIQNLVGKLQKLKLEELGLKESDLIRELAYLALRDPIDLCDENGAIRVDRLDLLPERIRRCIDGIKIQNTTDPRTGETRQTIELKLVSKLGAVELAMKHFGMLTPAPTEPANPDGKPEQPKLDWNQLYGEQQRLPDLIDNRLENERTITAKVVQAKEKRKPFTKK